MAMSQTQSSRLDSPAVKMFIKMLKEEDVTSTLKPKSLIWLQGIIVKVDEISDMAVLDDATATTQIDFSCMRRLRSHPEAIISVGSYVMVIGQIETLSPEPLVKGYKVSPISSSEVEQVMWEMEVTHQQRAVYKKRYDDRIKKYGDPMALYPMGY